MKCTPKLNLKKEFLEARGMETTPAPPVQDSHTKKYGNEPYAVFLKKYENLDEHIDNFKATDLVFFFKETSRQSGYPYFVANMGKDSGIMNRLLKEFSPREICGMIEFLFLSDQNYLDKNRLGIGVLSSGWVNTIYKDMLLWVDDKYVPRKQQDTKTARGVKNREWSSFEDTSSDDNVGVML